MKQLFIHKPLFRSIGPVFSGVIIYLLILLLNNSISGLDDLFANQELYLCIAFVYIIFELTRLSIIMLQSRIVEWSFAGQVVVYSLMATVVLLGTIYSGLYLYFDQYLGYEPSSAEYAMFIAIYGFASSLYLLLHFSHLFLLKESKIKIKEEQDLREALEFEFRNFKREMNPNLLLESLECLIVVLEENRETADELIDELSVVYRYILGNKGSELARVENELNTVEHLINLFWYQGKDVDFKHEVGQALCVPGTFPVLIEWLIRSSIHSIMQSMSISIYQNEKHIVIESIRKRKLSSLEPRLEDLNRAYGFYTDRKIFVDENNGYSSILVPLLVASEHENSLVT